VICHVVNAGKIWLPDTALIVGVLPLIEVVGSSAFLTQTLDHVLNYSELLLAHIRTIMWTYLGGTFCNKLIVNFSCFVIWHLYMLRPVVVDVGVPVASARAFEVRRVESIACICPCHVVNWWLIRCILFVSSWWCEMTLLPDLSSLLIVILDRRSCPCSLSRHTLWLDTLTIFSLLQEVFSQIVAR